jgi:hypothetical protein
MVRHEKVALAVFLITLGASAQNRMSRSGGCGARCTTRPAQMPSPARRVSIEISGRPFRHRDFRGTFTGDSYVGAWPYLASGYYDSLDFPSSYEPAPPAPPAPSPTPPATVVENSAPEPALLELQGNQWVRVSSFKTAVNEPMASTQGRGAKPMPPAVLVFRDGHREEVSSYSIIGPVLYSKADYWASGSWTRAIQIADLDITATLKENQERGVPFNLPSGPSEVVIRP